MCITQMLELDMKAKTVEIPVCEKALLTLTEAAAYFNIGENKLRELANDAAWDCTLRNGTKLLFKKNKFEEFLNEQDEI